MKTLFIKVAVIALLLQVGAAGNVKGCGYALIETETHFILRWYLCSYCDPHQLSTSEMAAVVTSQSATIVDARGTRAEKAHIPGARILSAYSSPGEIAQVLPNKNAPVVTYCASTSCGASDALASRLKGLGYTNIKQYPSGIKGWRAAGHKTESRL